MKRLPPAIGGLLFIGFVACSGPGNDGHRELPMELREQIPWINGVYPLVNDNGVVVMSRTPVYPEIATGEPDPGSSATSTATGDPIQRGCDAASRVTFATGWVETFERQGNAIPVALAWAGYDDGSMNSFRTPGFYNWYSWIDPETNQPQTVPAGFGLPADAIADGPSCDGQENSHALHFKGGRFNRYGAGIDHPLGLLDSASCPGSDFCIPPRTGSSNVNLADIPLRATRIEDGNEAQVPYAQPHMVWDLSSYDGIAFWARRGPEGQPTMLVKVQDKFTSDDLARENETFCRRLRPCDSHCLNGAPCQEVGIADSATYRCFEGDPAQWQDIIDSGLEDLVFPRCGADACTAPGTYRDWDFDQATCEPHTFPSNHESGEFCVNPGEEPAPPEERCGDGPGATVLLTTDWQFYTIPFSELRQLNFAKTEPYLDLKSIAMLSFIFTVGWVDVYLDNVTFYRNK